MMNLSKIILPEEIEKVLIEFDSCFPHLHEKVDDFELYAKKLSSYANVFVLDDKGLVIYYSNDVNTKIGYISLIGVKEQFQKEGLGKILINFSEDQMRNDGMHIVRLEVDNDNLNAIGFYEHLGYRIASAKTEESFYMEKKL